MASTGDLNKLKPAQRRAIAAILSSRDIKAAAAAANIPYRTVHRWVHQDANFILCLRAAETAAVEAVVRRLVGLADSAAQVIADTMADPDATAGHRLRAADLVLSSLLKLREMADLEARLLSLEEMLRLKDEQKPGPPFS